MPPTPSISFTCPQCSKKFSAPANAAGKSVKCSCGAQVVISAAQAPLPNAAPTASALPGPSMFTPATSAAISNSQPFAPSSSGSYRTPSFASRRKFPALDAAAKVFTILAWIYVVIGILGALFLLMATAASGQAEAIGTGIGGCIGLALVVLLAFIFIRAIAEMIRLALYIVELLEDIRAK